MLLELLVLSTKVKGSNFSLNLELDIPSIHQRLFIFVLSLHAGTDFRAANPPNFHGSLPILRPILRLYNSAMKTPDFSFFCIRIVGEVIHYVRLC